MPLQIEVMQQLGVSLNAVNLHDVFEDSTAVHLVMELCEGGSLLERVESTQYNERWIAGLVRSILRFIAQCHAKGIIYRDVKPDNFLFLNKVRSRHGSRVRQPCLTASCRCSEPQPILALKFVS